MLLDILKDTTLPYRFGFVIGHYYMNEKQIAQIRRVLNSRDSFDVVHAYEKLMTATIGNGHGMSFAAARMAFFCLLKSLGIGAGDEVVLTGFTCSVMPNAVLRTGAKPVFTDIDPETLGSCPSAISKSISSRTKIIVAQHSFGIPCKIQEIVDDAKSKGIFVLEDSAITLGSTIDGISTGNFGDAAIFSTDHSKPLNTVIGGFLYSKDEKLLRKVGNSFENMPDLDETHHHRLYNQMLFERKWYQPSRHPRSRLINSLNSRSKKLLFKERQYTFLEADYIRPETPHMSYPYPAKLPAFLAQIGIYELERWAKERMRRKDLLKRYKNVISKCGPSTHIPEAYSDGSLDIVPLRFVYRHSYPVPHRKLMSKSVDAGPTWFRAPIIGCNNPRELGYFHGSCVLSEQICGKIINWPCVVVEGWENKLLKFFESVVE